MNYGHLLVDDVFKTIGKVADDSNIQCYLIGGFVRDLLLQRPTTDIDVVCLGNGIDLAKQVAEELGVKKVSYFKNFGTAMLSYQDTEIEFVGARKESYRYDSRKPIVENGTLQDDLNRRDFTINALSIRLNKAHFGDLYDPFNGIEDLKNKCIKTPLAPAQTYSDDPLRMLRAIRFATQLKFKIEPDSFQAITDNKDRLEIVSMERIHVELNKILAADNPSTGFHLLFKSELLHLIVPELTALQGVEEVGQQSHKDNFYHTIQVVDNLALKSDNLWLRWAALMHDVGKAVTKKFVEGTGWTFHNHELIGSKMIPTIFKRLKLPLDDKMRYVRKIVKLSSRPVAINNKASDSAVRRLLFDAGDDIEDLMLLAESDITSKNKKRVKRYLDNFKEVRVKLKHVEKNDKVRNWQPPIDGDIIISTFGIKPGKEIGLIKDAIREAILEGQIQNNYDEAFNFMLEKGKSLNLIPVNE
jgi:poly(A) polymerase